MKKTSLLVIGLFVMLGMVIGSSVFVCAQGLPPFPGSKVLDSGPNPVGLGKPETTTFQYTIYLNAGFDNTKSVLDVVPAEFDITEVLLATCGSVVFGDKGGNQTNKLSPDFIMWDLTGCDNAASQSLSIAITTDQNPGHGKRNIPFFEPTSCGPLYLNDGATVIDTVTGESVTEPSNRLMVATCPDEADLIACVDVDGDGWSIGCNDCDDNNPSVNPGAAEICGDGIDNDCDGNVDEDCLLE